jgi:GntR family transcriptional regulator
MAQFGASRTAVREALAMLCDEGLIERRRGLGTTPVGAYYLIDLAIPPRAEGLEYPRPVSRVTPRILSWSWQPAPAVVAVRLDGVRPGDRCLAIEYVLLFHGSPAAVITNYLREAEGKRLEPRAFVGDFYSLLENEGIVLGDQTSTLQPQLADEHVARMLELSPGSAVQAFEQVIRDGCGEAFDLALGVFSGGIRLTVADSRPVFA